MTHLKIASALALVLAASGCDAPPRKTPAAAPVTVVDEGYRQKLLALSPGQRNSVFFKAISGNGGACPEVQRAVFQQDYKDQMMWVADCAITGDWAVFVSGGGYAQVRECRMMPKELPACKPLPPQ